IPILHVTQTERDCHTVKRTITKWQVNNICYDGVMQTFSVCEREHCRQKISSNDFCFGQSLPYCKRQISGASGDIENLFRFPARDDSRRAAAPVKICAATEEVIGEVVPPGDRLKDFPNTLSLFLVIKRVVRIHDVT